MVKWWKKDEPAADNERTYVTPLPGGGVQETSFHEDGVTPAVTEYLDADGKLIKTEYHSEGGDVIDVEEH